MTNRLPGRLPDLSATSAAELEHSPVTIDGLRVLFDHKVGVLPVPAEPAAGPPAPGAEGGRDPGTP